MMIGMINLNLVYKRKYFLCFKNWNTDTKCTFVWFQVKLWNISDAHPYLQNAITAVIYYMHCLNDWTIYVYDTKKCIKHYIIHSSPISVIFFIMLMIIPVCRMCGKFTYCFLYIDTTYNLYQSCMSDVLDMYILICSSQYWP